MRVGKLFIFMFVMLMMAASPSSLRAQDVSVPEPALMDMCPVCGMLVGKYPEWVASVVYKDGHAHHFDGAKDMFKFIFNMEKYVTTHSLTDIDHIAVTEYYDLRKINARTAFFVIGSDVTSPMGHDMVPLASRADAEEFLADHTGKRILLFDEVTDEIARKLDDGVFE